MTNVTSALAADRVIFNSDWNRRSFFEGMKLLFEHSRDGKLSHVLPTIERKSCVIWPPVEIPVSLSLESGPERGGVAGRVLHNLGQDRPTRIVWPHRWEHDKGPAALLEIARKYSESHNLRWIVLGKRYEDIPEEIKRFEVEFADRIDHIGYAEGRDTYWRWLSRADWVLSTATHEFFGIAVVEALLAGSGGAGALPWLPGALSYEEILPECAKGLSPMHPPGSPGDAETVRKAIREHLKSAVAANAVRRIDEAIIETGLLKQ